MPIDCKYAIKQDGNLVTPNFYKFQVEILYRIRLNLEQLETEHPEVDKITTAIESAIFKENGANFENWARANKVYILQKVRRTRELCTKSNEFGETYLRKKALMQDFRLLFKFVNVC